MKRYALFAGDRFYPEGGIKDLIDSFDAIEDALPTLTAGAWAIYTHGETIEEHNWCCLYDCVEDKIVLGLDANENFDIKSDRDYLKQHGLEQFKRGQRKDPPDYLDSPIPLTVELYKKGGV